MKVTIPKKPFLPSIHPVVLALLLVGRTAKPGSFAAIPCVTHAKSLLPQAFFYLLVVHLAIDKGTRSVLQQQSCSSLALNSSPFVSLHFLSFCIALSRNADEEGEG